jgi:hypothetical protein
MSRLTIAVALVLASVAPLHAGVEITGSGGRLDVTAAEAPVSEVLDGLARKTRMKVVYEGGAPRTPVTVELKDRTPAEAVLGVLEGLGLNYALALDISGTEVETLIVGSGALSGASDATGASGGAFRAPRANRREAARATPDEPEAESEDAMVEYESAPSPHEVPKVEEPAKPAPAMIGPLNPVNAFPGASVPLVTGPMLPIAPSPSPNPPTNH